MMILWFLTIEPKITCRSVPSSPGRSFFYIYFCKVNNLKSQRGCRVFVGNGSFQSISPPPLGSCENAPIFCEDFHERLDDGGDKLVENFSKRSETDFRNFASGWLTLAPIGQRYGKVPTWKSFAFTIIIWEGMKHHWEWVITRLHGVNAHRGKVTFFQLYFNKIKN